MVMLILQILVEVIMDFGLQLTGLPTQRDPNELADTRRPKIWYYLWFRASSDCWRPTTLLVLLIILYFEPHYVLYALNRLLYVRSDT